MVLLSILHTNQITEGSSTGVLYSFCRSALALHLAVKILLQIFLYEDLSTLTLRTSVGCISLQNANRTILVTPILLSENILIFDINHQQNKEVRPD